MNCPECGSEMEHNCWLDEEGNETAAGDWSLYVCKCGHEEKVGGEG
jgi:hypothetical protein